MKKDNRVLKNRDFSLIIKNGKKFHTSNLSFYYLKNNQNNFRIGISVSKKVSKLAVKRNKIKRQISALMSNMYDKNIFLDIVIIVKHSCSNYLFEDLKNNIDKFIKHIK